MSQSRDQHDENHWPGYVDALTTMLMVLTFVMMILGVAVFSTSQNASRILIEAIARAARVDPPIENVPVTALAERILDKLRRHPPRPPVASDQPIAATEQAGTTAVSAPEPMLDPTRAIVSQAPPVAAAPQAVRTQVAGEGFTITFQPRATRLDEEAAGRLKATLEGDQRVTQAKAVEIRAFIDTDTTGVTDAQRVAYYRVMVVRSAVMAAGVPPTRIRVLTERSPIAGQSGDVVRVVMIPHG